MIPTTMGITIVPMTGFISDGDEDVDEDEDSHVDERLADVEAG